MSNSPTRQVKIKMSFLDSRLQPAAPAPFLSLAAPWLLQGVLLICTTHGHPPFFGEAGADAYSQGSGPISGTAVYLLRLAIWLGTLFILVPLRRAAGTISAGRLLMLSLPLLALVSVLWSTSPKYTLGGGFDLLLLTLSGLYIGSAFRPDQQMQIFMVAGVIAGLSSLLIAGVAPTEGLDQVGHIGALKGIFTHKNSCGFSMALFATPAFFLRRSASVNRLPIWAYGSFCALLVVLSQSRTAWVDLVCLGLAAVSLRLLRAFRPKDSYVIGSIVVAVFSTLIYAVIANADALLGLVGKDATFSGRSLVWSAVFNAITKRPVLGYGYQAFFSSLSAGAGTLVMSTHFVVNHPHNGYLAIWLNLGLIGLLFFLALTLKAFRNGFNAWRLHPYTDWYICLILVVLVENLSEVSLVSADDLSWMLFIVACTGLHHAARSPAARPRSSIQARKPLEVR